VRTWIGRIVYEVKTIVAQYPTIAIPVARQRHGVPFGPGTELVIEGFPRTGTTFAVVAFHHAQTRSVRLAHDVHAPAQLIAAARSNVPALVMIREPEETVLSFVIRHQHISIRQALRGYIRFYAPLIDHLDSLVIGSFEEITTDFGAVIERLNARFGTAFTPFEHTEENVRACFAEIDAEFAMRASGLALDRSVARPSEVRARIKEDLRDRYYAPSLENRRRRADRIYEAFVSDSALRD
jgi:hypothetical protein